MFRRHKGLVQVLVLVIVLGALVRYFYLDHQDNSMKLKAANIRNHELIEERNSISRQLDVVSQSKLDMEYEIKTMQVNFKKSKEDCRAEKDKLQNEGNTFKAIHLKQYQSLETEHQMLKAQKETVETEFKHLQQSFDRMKDDHAKTKSNYDTNMAEVKAKHERVIASLQAQIEHYQKNKQSLQHKIAALIQEAAQKQEQSALDQRKLGDVGAKNNIASEKEVTDVDAAQKKSVAVQENKNVDSQNHGIFRRSAVLQQPNVKSQDGNDEATKQTKKELEIQKIESRDVEKQAKMKPDRNIEDKHEVISEDELQDLKSRDVNQQGIIEQNDDVIKLRAPPVEARNAQGNDNIQGLNVGMQQLNNDQKFADNNEDNLQGEENDDVAAEEDKPLDPEKLLGSRHRDDDV